MGIRGSIFVDLRAGGEDKLKFIVNEKRFVFSGQLSCSSSESQSLSRWELS